MTNNNINQIYFSFRISLPNPEYRDKYPEPFKDKKFQSAWVLMEVDHTELTLKEASLLGIAKLSELVGHGEATELKDFGKGFKFTNAVGYLLPNESNYPTTLENIIVLPNQKLVSFKLPRNGSLTGKYVLETLHFVLVEVTLLKRPYYYVVDKITDKGVCSIKEYPALELFTNPLGLNSSAMDTYKKIINIEGLLVYDL